MLRRYPRLAYEALAILDMQLQPNPQGRNRTGISIPWSDRIAAGTMWYQFPPFWIQATAVKSVGNTGMSDSEFNPRNKLRNDPMVCIIPSGCCMLVERSPAANFLELIKLSRRLRLPGPSTKSKISIQLLRTRLNRLPIHESPHFNNLQIILLLPLQI